MKCHQMGQIIFWVPLLKIWVPFQKLLNFQNFLLSIPLSLIFDVETLKVDKMVFFNNLYFFEVNMLRNLTN